MEYGYIRVSTKEQNEQRQLIAMREFGIAENRVYMDKQSGKDFERKKLQAIDPGISVYLKTGNMTNSEGFFAC